MGLALQTEGEADCSRSVPDSVRPALPVRLAPLPLARVAGYVGLGLRAAQVDGIPAAAAIGVSGYGEPAEVNIRMSAPDVQAESGEVFGCLILLICQYWSDHLSCSALSTHAHSDSDNE